MTLVDHAAAIADMAALVVPWYTVTIGTTDEAAPYSLSIYETQATTIVREYADEGLIGEGYQLRLRGYPGKPYELVMASNELLANLIPHLGKYPVYVESYLPGQLDGEGRPLTTINISVWSYRGSA